MKSIINKSLYILVVLSLISISYSCKDRKEAKDKERDEVIEKIEKLKRAEGMYEGTIQRNGQVKQNIILNVMITKTIIKNAAANDVNIVPSLAGSITVENADPTPIAFDIADFDDVTGELRIYYQKVSQTDGSPVLQMIGYLNGDDYSGDLVTSYGKAGSFEMRKLSEAEASANQIIPSNIEGNYAGTFTITKGLQKLPMKLQLIKSNQQNKNSLSEQLEINDAYIGGFSIENDKFNYKITKANFNTYSKQITIYYEDAKLNVSVEMKANFNDKGSLVGVFNSRNLTGVFELAMDQESTQNQQIKIDLSGTYIGEYKLVTNTGTKKLTAKLTFVKADPNVTDFNDWMSGQTIYRGAFVILGTNGANEVPFQLNSVVFNRRDGTLTAINQGNQADFSLELNASLEDENTLVGTTFVSQSGGNGSFVLKKQGK